VKLRLVASLAITLSPLAWWFLLLPILLILTFIYKPTGAQWLSGPEHWLPPKVSRWIHFGARSLQIAILFLYVAGVVILGLAMALLRKQPDAVFRVLDRTKVDFRKDNGWSSSLIFHDRLTYQSSLLVAYLQSGDSHHG